jgi:hypothetical protein
LSGQAFDASGTAALVIQSGRIWYLDSNGEQSPPAEDRGTAKMLYNYPVEWHEDETQTFFAGSAASESPTGLPITITMSVTAAAIDVATPSYTGLVVGILETFEYSSGSETSELVIFEPGAVPPDRQTAKEQMIRLATKPAPPLPEVIGGDADCIQQCKATFDTEVKNAWDSFATNTKVICAVAGIPAGFLTGCGAGAGICWWLIPPAGPAACCIAGGIIGSGVGYAGCVYTYQEILNTELRAAERRYRDCVTACGGIIADI